MKKTLISVGVIMALAAIVVTSNPVFAVSMPLKDVKKIENERRGNASSTASTTFKRAAKLDEVTGRLQERADKEIDRRVGALNKLQEKIQGMKRISVALKTSFATTIQAQINLLNNLKIKINSTDTDAATLKADVQSITRAYRIYALILPQIEIVVAAEKLASTTESFSTLAVKLQSRITTAQTAGKDVAALQALLANINAKIVDAKLQSANAITGVSALVPDNGDKTIMETNSKALKAARTAVRTGSQDLKDARKDIEMILNGLKSLE